MNRINIVFTEKEREEYKKIVLDKLPEGAYDVEIADIIGISDKSVSKFRNELVNENKITQKEIDEARQRRKEEEKKNDPRRKRILERLKVRR